MEQPLTFLIIYLILWAFSYAATANFVKLHLLRREMTRYNFRLDPVPMAVGVSMVLCFLFYQMGFLLLQKAWRIWQWSIWEPGLGALAVAFLGLYDDMFKRHERGSVKTHLAMLTSDKVISSGVLSVVGVFLVAMVLRIRLDVPGNEGGVDMLLLNVLLITLSSTFLGLVNTRPLRALKVSLSLVWAIALASLYLNLYHPDLGTVHDLTWRFSMPIVFIAMGYWHYERVGRAMMGAVGTNFLGFALGVFLVNELSLELKVTALALLVLVHLVALLTDLGTLIDRWFLLRFFDRLGRRDNGPPVNGPQVEDPEV